MYKIVCSFALVMFLFSCKNDTKSPEAGVAPEKKELTESDKRQVNSVMTKTMMTGDLSKFSSILVTAEMVEKLSKGKGPYTVFAPSNGAWDNLPEEDFNALLSQDNRATLKEVINNHIVDENMDSATLVQTIKKKGSYRMKTLGGIELKASMQGDSIMITGPGGVVSAVGNSDIMARNGVVHVLDKVLLAPKQDN